MKVSDLKIKLGLFVLTLVFYLFGLLLEMVKFICYLYELIVKLLPLWGKLSL